MILGRQTMFGVSLLLLTAVPSLASNGMNMIGFGAESVAMGGADLAMTKSACSMNINPAGIAQPGQAMFEFGLTPMNPSLSHTDTLGNNRADDLQRYPMPYIGYTHPMRNVSLGIGFFAQGGLGAEYNNLSTPFSVMAASGTLPTGFFDNDLIPAGDDTQTNIAHAKLTPTMAWRINPQVTVGVALNVSHLNAEMKLFPETSVVADLDQSGVAGDSPRDAFFGMDLQNASSTGYGLRLGAQYRKGPFMLAGAYVTETDLDLEGGDMTLNLTALGLGKVHYDAKMVGFAWPRQAGVGTAYQMTPRFTLAADMDWTNWADAIGMLTIELENPDVPSAPSSRKIPFPMNWKNQWVWALGAEVTPAPNWTVRMGYNHSDTPIPAQSLRPLFPAIAEDHVTAGFGVSKGTWTFDMAFEYVAKNELTNDSADPTVNPFGPGSQESLSQFATHFLLRRTLSKR